MNGLRWLPEAFVHLVNHSVVRDHGGRAGLRDPDALAAAMARPVDKHDRGVAEPFALAAGYGFTLARARPFEDGNLRTALMVMCSFLRLNGYELDASEPDAVSALRRIAEGDMLEGELGDWLRERSREALL